MSYIKGRRDDEEEHAHYHDQVVNGVGAPPSETDYVIWQEGDQRITLVTSDSPSAKRELAHKVATMANLETQYDCGIMDWESDAFLYHAGVRVLGLIVCERREHIWRARWQGIAKPPLLEELSDHEPMWSVVFVWVHKKARRRHIAQRLFTEAIRFLSIVQEGVGWYTPFTEEGRAFVERLYPNEFHVAK